MADGEQLAFDFEELEREEARATLGSWVGAPLHFTTDYYSPADLDAAFEHWCFLNGHFDSINLSHMWHRRSMERGERSFGEHSMALFSASMWVERGMEGPSTSPVQAICEPCQWQYICAEESEAVEAWHDHGVPGWRELPVMPAEIRVRNDKGFTKLARKWIEVHYPEELQVPGAPIVTERGPYGRRHIPGGSPYGGYDLSASALTPPSEEEPSEAITRDELNHHHSTGTAAPSAQRSFSPVSYRDI